MTTEINTHYERFRYNQSVAQALEKTLPEHKDWCSVVMFYAALHLLDGYLKSKKLLHELDTHSARNRAIKNFPELRRGHMNRAYRELQDISEQVRYDPGFQFEKRHQKSASKNLDTIIKVLDPMVKKLLRT